MMYSTKYGENRFFQASVVGPLFEHRSVGLSPKDATIPEDKVAAASRITPYRRKKRYRVPSSEELPSGKPCSGIQIDRKLLAAAIGALKYQPTRYAPMYKNSVAGFVQLTRSSSSVGNYAMEINPCSSDITSSRTPQDAQR